MVASLGYAKVAKMVAQWDCERVVPLEHQTAVLMAVLMVAWLVVSMVDLKVGELVGQMGLYLVGLWADLKVLEKVGLSEIQRVDGLVVLKVAGKAGRLVVGWVDERAAL
jgi:hypothetical protein